MAQRLVQVLEFGLHRQARIGGQLARHALGGRVGPVRGGEGVVDIDVRELGELVDERRVVGLLAGVVPEIFQQDHPPVRDLADVGLRLRSDAVVAEGHRFAKKRRQGRDHRR